MTKNYQPNWLLFFLGFAMIVSAMIDLFVITKRKDARIQHLESTIAEMKATETLKKSPE